MGSLINFPFSQELTIYLPFNSSPNDEFEAITITDDSLVRGTIYKGDIVIVQLGLIQREGLHAVEMPTGELYAGFLVHKNGLIYLESNNDDYEPEIFHPDKVKILGRAVQVYPSGDMSRRWELIRVPQRARRRPRARAK